MAIDKTYQLRWHSLPESSRGRIVDAAVAYHYQLWGHKNHASYSFNRWWLDHFAARRYYLHPYWLIEFPNRESYTRFVLTWM